MLEVNVTSSGSDLFRFLSSDPSGGGGGGTHNGSFANLTDCYGAPDTMLLKTFAISLKPYMYPATIEFSITCATIFIILWHKIGRTANKNVSLLPTSKHIVGVGTVNMPYSNLFIMLDCTKTSKGLFFGLLFFAFSLLSFVLFVVYKGTVAAQILSEVTESILLTTALVITLMAFRKVRRNYTKIKV